jgi:hypothetical protein
MSELSSPIRYERKPIGNFRVVDKEACGGIPDSFRALRLDWWNQGIDYIISDPIPTENQTVEQLLSQGLKSITLMVPIKENKKNKK